MGGRLPVCTGSANGPSGRTQVSVCTWPLLSLPRCSFLPHLKCSQQSVHGTGEHVLPEHRSMQAHFLFINFKSVYGDSHTARLLP